MIKGCQRRIIMVKDTGSRYFDSAYFVLKSDLPDGGSDSDMLGEAHRMIEACSVANAVELPSEQKKQPPRTREIVAYAFAALGLIAAVILLIV